MKTNLTLIIIILVLLFGMGITFQTLLNVKADRERISLNFQNQNKKLDSTRNANGELHLKVNKLILNKEEFIKYSEELTSEINKLNIKIKNIESVTKVEIKYVYIYDTIWKAKKINDTTFIHSFENTYINYFSRIRLINNKTDINVDSLKIGIKDNLLIIDETEYKGWWFWKKAIGVKLHIKSENPHFNIDKIESIKFNK